MKRREPAKRAAVTGKVGRVAVRSQPLVAVRDVEAASRWYQWLLARTGADAAPRGHGVLLWFELDDFDAAVRHDLGAEVVEDVHVNPNAHHRELWLRDLDGYVVVIASPDGEAGGALTSRAASPRRRARSRPAP